VAAYRSLLNAGPNTVVALYYGNMGEKQGLEILADVARLCAASTAYPILFVFGGSLGVGRTKLTAQCNGLPNVRFIDLQPVEQKPDFLACADIHLLPQRADAADLVMPSKLTGMLASARPVVATAHQGTELATVVNICGLVVPPEDPVAMANAVLQLAADPAMRERLGAAGFMHAQEHMETDTVLRMWSVISSPFGSSDLDALRRYKSLTLMWHGHTARFAPSIASQC
jgi:colanic acid biosynthesis glycosyl transferase WcaI